MATRKMTASKLRDELAKTFIGVRDGTVKPQTAQALASVAGKMVSSAFTQVQYYKQRNETPNIAFLTEE